MAFLAFFLDPAGSGNYTHVIAALLELEKWTTKWRRRLEN